MSAPLGWPLAHPLLLAAGHDRSGERAATLLAAGFAAVEFGSVGPRPSGRQPGAAALAAHLRVLPRQRAAIGINLGLDADAPCPADDWPAGLHACLDAADYLAFNLSADTARPWLAPAATPLLARVLRELGRQRDARAAAGGRRVALALKLPLAAGIPPLAGLAARAGFDALIAVLPGEAGAAARGMAALRAALHLPGGQSRVLAPAPALIAVGGVRCAADVVALLAAGACAVQVHTAYAERGAACVGELLAGALADTLAPRPLPAGAETTLTSWLA